GARRAEPPQRLLLVRLRAVERIPPHRQLDIVVLRIRRAQRRELRRRAARAEPVLDQRNAAEPLLGGGDRLLPLPEAARQREVEVGAEQRRRAARGERLTPLLHRGDRAPLPRRQLEDLLAIAA